MTQLYGVIGDPVSHSLSPVIHRGWYRDHGIDADYRALRVASGETASGLETLTRQGFRGLNVTLPHKSAVLDACQTVSSLAARLGAVNTLRRTSSGGWEGENTDYGGFLDDLAEGVDGTSPRGRTVLVLGAGGAARAVALALWDSGARLTLANRTLARARTLCADLGLEGVEVIDLEAGMARRRDVDIVVNTTSLGHAAGEAITWPAGDGRFVYDISYGPAAGPNLEAARASGWRTRDGLGMLVAQAARAFTLWFGLEPDRSVAMKRCRTALEMAGG